MPSLSQHVENDLKKKGFKGVFTSSCHVKGLDYYRFTNPEFSFRMAKNGRGFIVNSVGMGEAGFVVINEINDWTIWCFKNIPARAIAKDDEHAGLAGLMALIDNKHDVHVAGFAHAKTQTDPTMPLPAAPRAPMPDAAPTRPHVPGPVGIDLACPRF
jgi:hypothetical protein